MQFSIGVEYAFHSLFYMIEIPVGKTIGIKELAQLNNISETYLSKVFTKLRKAGLVRSMPGTNGGYELAKSAEHISFWDIVEAVEGSSHFFQCAEIRQKNILSQNVSFSGDCPCLIKVVMMEAEEEMRNYLRKKTLAWLYAEVYQSFSDDKKSLIAQWLTSAIKK